MSEVDTLGVPLPLYNFAVELHENWRASLNDKQSSHSEMLQGTECNMNVEWNDLHIFAKLRKLDDVVDAYNSLIVEEDTQKCLEYLHDMWVRRNPITDQNRNLHVSYVSLPLETRARYQEILNTVKQIKDNQS